MTPLQATDSQKVKVKDNREGCKIPQIKMLAVGFTRML